MIQKLCGCGHHNKNCYYKDTDAMLYCLMQITENKEILIAASEILLFDTYLNLAKQYDKGICIDMDTCDSEAYQIVYGGLMYTDDKEWSEIKKYAENLKGYALIDLSENPQNIVASVYDDIIFYPDKAKMGRFVPFAALMKTKFRYANESSITLFPCCDRLVWENLVNRPFLLACRKFIQCPEGITVKNWKEYININEMQKAYNVADLYVEEG